MADPTGAASYLTIDNEDATLSNSRQISIQPGSGLEALDFGPGGQYVLQTVGKLNDLNDINQAGFVVATSSGSPSVTTLVLNSSASITVTNGNGVGAVSFAVVPNSTTQNINYFAQGIAVPSAVGPNLNLTTSGLGINITPTFDGITNTITYQFSLGSGGGGGGGNDGHPFNNTAPYAANQDIDFANNAAYDLSSLSFISITNPLTPTGGGAFQVVGTQANPIFSNASGAYNLVTCTTANYGNNGSVLIGNGVNYDSLIIGSVGQVLTLVSGSQGLKPAWATGGGGGSGGHPFDATSPYAANQNVFFTNVGSVNPGIYAIDVIGYVGFNVGAVVTETNSIFSVSDPIYPAPTFGFNDLNSETYRVPLIINTDIIAGTPNSLLIGNGNTSAGPSYYTGLAASTTPGDVLTIQGNGAVGWETPSTGGLQNVVQLLTGGRLFVSDASINSNSVILTNGIGESMTPGFEPAAGPVHVDLQPGIGFTLIGLGPIGANPGDAGKFVAYANISNGTGGGGGGGGGNLPNATNPSTIFVDFVMYASSSVSQNPLQRPSPFGPGTSYTIAQTGPFTTSITASVPFSNDPAMYDGYPNFTVNGPPIGTKILFIDENNAAANGIYTFAGNTGVGGGALLQISADFSNQNQLIFGTKVYVKPYINYPAFTIPSYANFTPQSGAVAIAANGLSVFQGQTFTFISRVTTFVPELFFECPLLGRNTLSFENGGNPYGATPLQTMITFNITNLTPYSVQTGFNGQPLALLTTLPYGGRQFIITGISSIANNNAFSGGAAPAINFYSGIYLPVTGSNPANMTDSSRFELIGSTSFESPTTAATPAAISGYSYNYMPVNQGAGGFIPSFCSPVLKSDGVTYVSYVPGLLLTTAITTSQTQANFQINFHGHWVS